MCKKTPITTISRIGSLCAIRAMRIIISLQTSALVTKLRTAAGKQNLPQLSSGEINIHLRSHAATMNAAGITTDITR